MVAASPGRYKPRPRAALLSVFAIVRKERAAVPGPNDGNENIGNIKFEKVGGMSASDRTAFVGSDAASDAGSDAGSGDHARFVALTTVLTGDKAEETVRVESARAYSRALNLESSVKEKNKHSDREDDEIKDDGEREARLDKHDVVDDEGVLDESGKGNPSLSRDEIKEETSTPSSVKKSVSFHCVEVREYLRALGDHPDAMLGPPITLDWEYCTPWSKPLGVDEYESGRGERRTKTQLLVHPNVRRRWLMEESDGSIRITEKEIKAAEREVRRAALRRRHSAAFHPLTHSVEDCFQSIKRKLKRRSWRSNDLNWWEQKQI